MNFPVHCDPPNFPIKFITYLSVLGCWACLGGWSVYQNHTIIDCLSQHLSDARRSSGRNGPSGLPSLSIL